MATENFTDSPRSVNTTDELHARLQFLEEENSRLRHLLSSLENSIRDAEPGQHLFGDDGVLDGPYPDIERAAINCANDGVGCTIITVVKHVPPAEQEIDEEVGLGYSVAPRPLLKTAA